MIHHFDHLARIYDRFAGQPNLTLLENLMGLPVEGRILDTGGGTGRVSYPFLSQAGGVVVADASLHMLRAAEQKGRFLLVRSLAESLPFYDSSFERILVVDALHHFQDAHKSIGELSRVLGQGGRLVIEEPDLRRWPVKAVALAEKLLLMKSRFFAPPSILDMLGRCGLSARIAASDRFRVWIAAEKPSRSGALSVLGSFLKDPGQLL